jgi:hypothetical protein
MSILNEIEAGDGGNYSIREILDAVSTITPCGRARYRTVAFAAISLRAKLGKLETAKKRLLNAGISLSTWKNAMHLVCVYDDIVESKHADLKWFGTVHIERAHQIKRILAKRGTGWLNRSGLLRGTERDWAEISHLSETGQTYAESRALFGTA